MNRFELLFVGLLVFAFLLDGLTFIWAASKGLVHLEANPLRVLFGEAVFYVLLPLLSVFFVWYFRYLIVRVDSLFRKGVVALFAGTVVSVKVLASFANVSAVLNSGALAVVVRSPGELLFAYGGFFVSNFLWPLGFSLLFFWVFWKWFVEGRVRELVY